MSNRPGVIQSFGGARLQNIGTPTATTDAVPRGFIRYDWSTGCVGKPGAAEVFPYFIVPTAFIIPANAVGSRSRCLTAATNTATWSLNKVNSAGSSTQLFTLSFAASATTGTFSNFSAISIVDSDLLYWTAPGSQDISLSDISITIAGIR